MGAFTSTIQTDKGPKHARIYRNTVDGSFYFSNETTTYPSLCALVDAHDLFASPCDDWPYASCFPGAGSGVEFIASLKGQRPKMAYVKKGYIFSIDEVDTKEISKVRKKSRKKKREESEKEGDRQNEQGDAEKDKDQPPPENPPATTD